MGAFKRENGDWLKYRELPGLCEVDFHWADGQRKKPYWEVMEDVRGVVLNSLAKAQEEGKQYVLFTHGLSTSGPGKTTARSQIRVLMRSKDATPYIDRKKCIQHESVFVAAIRSG